MINLARRWLTEQFRRSATDNPDLRAKVQILRAAEGFEQLSESELLRTASYFQLVVLPADAKLMREGRPSHTLWLIVEGFVQITVRGHLLREHGPGELLGLPTMLDGGVAGVTASAYGAVRLLSAPERHVRFLVGNPKVELSLRTASARRLRRDYFTVVSLTSDRPHLYRSAVS